MDLFSIVASVVVALVGGALSWALKKGAEKSDSDSMDMLMDQLDRMLCSVILPQIKTMIRKELQEQVPQYVENKYVGFVLDQLHTMAPKVLKGLGFTEEGLTEYVRGFVRGMIEDLVGSDNANAQEG